MVWESEKAEHEGDLWHNTSDNTQWIYKSGIWQPQSIPNELLDKIDGKSSVYMVQPKPPYYEGDLWVTTNSEGKASLKTSTVNRVGGAFDASDWIDFKYADKDDIKNAIDKYDTSLGQALANYAAFERSGFKTVGIFDVNPVLKGISVRGIEIRMADELPEFIKEHHVEIAALTLPKAKAVEMAEILVDNGVKAIWNFAHTDLNLKLPKDVIVENVHLSESLMRLSYNLLHPSPSNPHKTRPPLSNGTVRQAFWQKRPRLPSCRA